MTEPLLMQLHGAGVFFPPRGLAAAGTWALKDVSVALRRGDRVAIMGDNGSGKTTLLKALAGLQELSEGTRTIRDERIPAKRAQADSIRICIASQQPGESIIDEFTIADNLILRRLSFLSETARKNVLYQSGRTFLRGTEFLALLDDAFFEPAGRLSGGWKQLLQIASIVFAEPELVLLDEPTNHLSSENAGHVMRLLAALPAEVVMVFVTHASGDQLAPVVITQNWRLRAGRVEDQS